MLMYSNSRSHRTVTLDLIVKHLENKSWRTDGENDSLRASAERLLDMLAEREKNLRKHYIANTMFKPPKGTQ